MNGIQIMIAFVVVALISACVIGFSLFVREMFHRDVAPPDLHTEWDRNPWLRDKGIITGKHV